MGLAMDDHLLVGGNAERRQCRGQPIGWFQAEVPFAVYGVHPVHVDGARNMAATRGANIHALEFSG